MNSGTEAYESAGDQLVDDPAGASTDKLERAALKNLLRLRRQRRTAIRGPEAAIDHIDANGDDKETPPAPAEPPQRPT